jgi:MFS superfamily sulfate permease-like transporter
VARVGEIRLQFGAPAVPDLPQGDWLRLGELAFAMVLMLYAESYASIRNAALRHGDPFSPNRDLLALGAANLVSGLFQGMPVAAGFSATSANEASGPKTRLAGALAAAVVLLAVLQLMPLVAWIPQPVLAAVVVHAVSHSLSPAVFQPYLVWRRDRLVAFAAVLAVLLLGVLDGLLVAVGASLMLALRDLSQAKVTELVRLDGGHAFVDRAAHPGATGEPGLLILRPEAPLFFASADGLMQAIAEYLAAQPQTGTLILSLEESPDLDSSGVEALRDLAARLAAEGRRLQLTRVHGPVIALLLRAQLPGLDAGAIATPSVDDAVRAARAAG